MKSIYEKTLRYDFYGELLTKRQREIYEAVVFNDMSLAEAAEEYGVSRQGIHDVIRRSDETMAKYEEKLHNISQYESVIKNTEKLKEAIKKSSLPDEEKQKLVALSLAIENSMK